MYRLSETQAQEILNMRLQRLTGLEQDKIVNEYKDIMATIDDLLDIMSRPERVTAIIGNELAAIKADFSTTVKDIRRSRLEHTHHQLDTYTLTPPPHIVPHLPQHAPQHTH